MRRSKTFWVLSVVGAILLGEISYRLVTSYFKTPQDQFESLKRSRCQDNWQETLFFGRVSVCLPPDLRPEVNATPDRRQSFRHSSFWLFFADGGSNACTVHESYQQEKDKSLIDIYLAGEPATITMKRSVPVGDLGEAVIGDALALCVPDIGDGHKFTFVGTGQKMEVFEQIMSSIKFELK